MDNDGAPAAEQEPQCGSHADGVDLFRYMGVVWKYKLLILLGTLAGGVAGTVYCLRVSDEYTATYQYANEQMTMRAYRMFENRFYSQTNIARLKAGFEAAGIADGPEIIGPEGPVRLEVWPEIMREGDGPSRMKPEDIEKTLDLKSELLLVHVSADSRQRAEALGRAVCDNIENTMALEEVIDGLSEVIRQSRSQLAQEEEVRFATALALTTQKETLERLKALEPPSGGTEGGDVNLQFALTDQTEFLPLPVYISSIEKTLVEMEEEDEQELQLYEYNQRLISVQQSLSEQAEEALRSGRGMSDFARLIAERAEQEPDTELRDYLSAYSKRVENKVASRIPVSDAPPVGRSGLSGIKVVAAATVGFFAVCVVLAFVVEGFVQARRLMR